MLSTSFEEDAKKIKSVLFEEQNISTKENIIIDIIKKYDSKQRLLLRITYDQIFPENNFLTDINTNLTQSM